MKAAGIKEMSLIDAPSDERPATALVVQEQAVMLPMIERLAALPDFDVAKLEKLLDMQERIMDRQAEAAFNAAFAEMQAAIPTILEKGKTDKGKYARQEDIVKVIRPILKAHGFSLSFRTEWPEKQIKIVGILTHREGHTRESQFLTDADSATGRNAIQARGSAVTYGRRYTTTDLLNITSSEQQDDDGYRTGVPDQPVGFAEWWADMVAVADEGYPALERAFKASKPAFRDYVMAHGKSEIEALKVKAKAKTGAV